MDKFDEWWEKNAPSLPEATQYQYYVKKYMREAFYAGMAAGEDKDD
jgi:hypothetical protein